MSNFFTEVVDDLDGLEQKLLGPDYAYYKQIKAPEYIGMSSDGNLGAMANDIGGLIAYTKLLVEGGGPASTIPRPLGDKFFLKTGAKCKDVATNKQVTRSIYINNIPDGDIPFISNGLGTDFSVFEGIVPGVMGNLAKINPLAIFQSFMGGINPDCQAVTMETVNADNFVSQDTGYISVTDLKSMNPCWFIDNINPITKKTRAGCSPPIPETELFGNKCNIKLGMPSQFEPFCQALKLNTICNEQPFCVWGGNGIPTFSKNDITITGRNGITIGINKDIAISNHGADQQSVGCWSFNTNDSKYGGNWGEALKKGNSCSASSISLPDGIEAYAYTSGGAWNNLCNQEFVGFISAGTKNADLKTMNPCGFLFKKADTSKIHIIGKNGRVVSLIPSQVINTTGPGQDTPGCWSLDTNRSWQQALKSGSGCAVAYISLPNNVEATAYTSSGSWNNLCNQQKIGVIKAGTQGHKFPVSPCGFLFKSSSSNEGFTNLTPSSYISEISTIMTYTYVVSILIVLCYLLSRIRSRK